MFIFYPIIEIFILDIENTFIKIEEKKKGSTNRCEEKTIQTPT